MSKRRCLERLARHILKRALHGAIPWPPGRAISEYDAFSHMKDASMPLKPRPPTLH